MDQINISRVVEMLVRGLHVFMVAAWLIFDFVVYWLHFKVKDATAPTQITRLRAAMAAPHARVTFAGEHASVVAPGIEGALEAAERAVDELRSMVA